MTKKLLLLVLSITSITLQSCRNEDKHPEGGGGGETGLTVSVTAGVSGLYMALTATTSENTSEHIRYFEMDTVPSPAKRYDSDDDIVKPKKEKVFTTGNISVPAVNNVKLYYRAVVVNGPDTVRSQVGTCDASTFPFITASVRIDGNTVTVDGRFPQALFDKNLFGEINIRILEIGTDIFSGGTQERTDVNDDGSFRFTITDVPGEGEYHSCGDYYLCPEYEYDHKEYRYPRQNIPSHWFFHIGTDDYIEIPDETFRTYAVTNFGSDGCLTASQAEAAEGIDIRGLGVKSLEGLNAFRNIRYLYCDETPLEELEISEVFRRAELRQVTCSKCTNLYVINLNSNLMLLDCHDCPALSEINRYSLYYENNYGIDRFICHGCGLAELKNTDDSHVSLDCSHNALSSIKGFKSISNLNCSHNELTELKLTGKWGVTRIDTLDCSSNQLTLLDLTGHRPLKYADCTDNPELDTILVSNSYDTSRTEEEVIADFEKNFIKDAHTKFIFAGSR